VAARDMNECMDRGCREAIRSEAGFVELRSQKNRSPAPSCVMGWETDDPQSHRRYLGLVSMFMKEGEGEAVLIFTLGGLCANVICLASCTWRSFWETCDSCLPKTG
jgi:hypothetical protein